MSSCVLTDLKKLNNGPSKRFRQISDIARYNIRALHVYTHHILRILKFWKALAPPWQEAIDLKRRLVARPVESPRLLRIYIDSRAKGRGTTRAQWIVLFRLRQQEGLPQVDLAGVLEMQ